MDACRERHRPQLTDHRETRGLVPVDDADNERCGRGWVTALVGDDRPPAHGCSNFDTVPGTAERREFQAFCGARHTSVTVPGTGAEERRRESDRDQRAQHQPSTRGKPPNWDEIRETPTMRRGCPDLTKTHWFAVGQVTSSHRPSGE